MVRLGGMDSSELQTAAGLRCLLLDLAKATTDATTMTAAATPNVSNSDHPPPGEAAVDEEEVFTVITEVVPELEGADVGELVV